MGRPRVDGGALSGRRLLLAAMLVAAVPLVAYPLRVVASGGPAFPGGRGECARLATGDGQGPVELVFAHLPSIASANALRARLGAEGFANVQVTADGCGYWKVADESVETFARAVGAAAEARRAGFRARVELDPGS